MKKTLLASAQQRIRAATAVLMSLPVWSIAGLASDVHAISFGQPDNYRHPNVVSLRFVKTNLDATFSCTGTLIHKDAVKYVFLTAGHCAQPELDGWNAAPPGSGSVGVSFDEVNLPEVVDGPDGAIHVTGGVAIPHPLYRFVGANGNNDRFDQALVVVPVNARNSLGQTIASRWGHIPGALTPATTVNQAGFVDALVAGFASPSTELRFTAVGFGTQSAKSPQGSGEGNKVKEAPYGSFPVRNQTTVGFKNLNGYMVVVVQNTTQGDDFGYTCPGDSGSPNLYRDRLGNEIILGVLTTGNCRSYGAYSRIDYQEVLDLINCARAAGDSSAVAACVEIRFGRR
ncbi:MAG: hypothetical protein ACKVQU_27440 [Burkholderiales bacterium]